MAARLRAMDGGVTPITSGSTEKSDTSASLEKKIQELTESLAMAEQKASEATTENTRLKEELEKSDTSSKEGAALSAESMDETLNELKELRESIEPLRHSKDVAEAKVIELTKENKQSDATIANLQKRLGDEAKASEEKLAEIDKLKSTIENNLYAHAEAEAELRAEIKRLNELLIAPRATNAEEPAPSTYAAPAPATKRRKKKRKSGHEYSAQFPGMTDAETQQEPQPVKISAIDELMDSTDWFVAPDPVPLKKDPEVEENFGYKEPAKKNEAPEDDRQLTLW